MERAQMFAMKERIANVSFVILRYFGNKYCGAQRLDGIEKTYSNAEYQLALEELKTISKKKPGLYVLAGTGTDWVQYEEVCFKALIGSKDGKTVELDEQKLNNEPTDWSDDIGAMDIKMNDFEDILTAYENLRQE